MIWSSDIALSTAMQDTHHIDFAETICALLVSRIAITIAIAVACVSSIVCMHPHPIVLLAGYLILRDNTIAHSS